MKNICIKDKDNDLTFVIGSRHYDCPWLIAEFLSPYVCQCRSVDDIINEMIISIDDSNDVLGSLMLIGRRNEVEISRADFVTVMLICRELGNSELYEVIFREFSDDITIDNVFERMKLHSAMDCNILDEIDFVSSHFYEIKNGHERLKSIGSSVMREILSKPGLKIGSEDILYDLIIGVMTNDCEFQILLQFVRFEYLSTSKFIEFLI
jgi:hypothetical protein